MLDFYEDIIKFSAAVYNLIFHFFTNALGILVFLMIAALIVDNILKNGLSLFKIIEIFIIIPACFETIKIHLKDIKLLINLIKKSFEILIKDIRR